MAFVVEDGTGLSTSTSYVDLDYAEAFADSFFSDTDYTAWSEATDSSKERSLNRATQYIDRTYIFSGERTGNTQALEFPRDDCYDCLGNLIDDVPVLLKQAVCMAASRLLNSTTALDPDVDRKTIREKIDTIDITYSEASGSLVRYTEMDNMLSQSCFVLRNRNRTVNVRLTQG